MARTPGGSTGAMREVDVYDLPDLLGENVTGVYLTGDVDQEFLVENRDALSTDVMQGGRVMVNGHVQRPFLEGLVRWRKLVFRNPSDLVLARVSEHPVWRGIAPEVLLYSTGRSGPVPMSELAEIGVAGFYGRGCYLHLPPGSTVIHTIGPTAAPIDYEYPLGTGRVLVHGGNDLLQFASDDRGTAALRTQLVQWLRGEN